ncbi:MAG: Lrp/AsnC family transcriptional regulator [Candidatus Woesearchaeota archaeon]
MVEKIEKIYSLDLKDKKLLFELDKDARKSFPQIGKKIGLSQEVVFHRVNRLMKRGIIKRFQTVASISRMGYIAPKIYIQLQNISHQKQEELYAYLRAHSNIFWFGICQGRWDLIIAYWSRDTFEFGTLVDDLLYRFSTSILERQITIGKNTIQFNRRWFYHDNLEPIESDFGSAQESVQLDRIDEKILRYLGNNARLSVVELAKLIKTTASVVHYHLKQLEKSKIIVGYKISIDAHTLGYESCKSFIYFQNITEKRRRELIAFCKMHPHIINIVLCVGPWDMEIEFEVENFDQFYDLMNKVKEKFPDIIKNYESVVFKEEPKQSFVPLCYPEL